MRSYYKSGGSVKKSPAWTRKEGKSESGGLNAKGVASYRKANPGSKLKTAVTTKPSKLKKGSKAANRRKSFCARMKGMKKRNTSSKTANDPDSRINKSLRKWNCQMTISRASMPKELTGNRTMNMKKKLPKDLMAKKSITQMPGDSKRQRADTNMTREQEKRLADQANEMRGEAKRDEDRMSMPSMMKKGGKVKKMMGGGKIRGYGMARGGKVCKMR